MKTRKLGWTGLQFTTIGVGTWAMGGGDWTFAWGPQDDAESIRALRRSLDLGINWIDTAPAYGLGHGEEIVGRALQGLTTKPFIATKCGRSWDSNRQLVPNLKAATIRTEVEASLKRLQVDVIDLYQIHWPQPVEDIEEAWAVVAAVIKEGKVRFGGVCNFNLEQLRRLHAIFPVASLQPPYSMLVREVEAGLLAYCAQNNIGVLAYSPMQKGLLTGKFTAAKVQQLPAGDHRRRDPMFQEPRLSNILRQVESLRQLAERNQRSLAELAIAWVLRQPEVTSAIVGTRSPAQIEAVIPAADWSLSTADAKAIEQILTAGEPAQKC